MSERLARYGTEEVPESARILRLGDWTLEWVDGDVKNICFQQQEVIRSIGYVVRDANWGTWKQQHDEAVFTEAAGVIGLTLTSRCQVEHGITLLIQRHLQLTGNQLSFSASATPDGDMQTARCGFTVLYPLQGVTGSPVTVTTPEGEQTRAHFPVLIEPWQPFKQIGQLQYQHASGLEVTTQYRGDVFEMEDQRAWLDGSYKVYSRPLALPWPYDLAAGQSFTQQIQLTVSAPASLQTVTPVARQTTPHPSRVPDIALLITEAQCHSVASLAQAIDQLAPQALRAYYHPGENSAEFLATLRAVQQAMHHTCPLTLEYVLPVEQGQPFAGHLSSLAAEIARTGLVLHALIPSPAPDLTSTPPGSQWPWCPPLEAIYQQARAHFPTLQLGGGMLSYFTELNRKRPPVALVDFITHATCPIVHAADDRSVMQTLESVPFVTDSTRAIIGDDTPYAIGPAMISMRSNPYGKSVYPNPEQIRLTMTNADVRQRGLFYASWLVGYLAALAQSGVSQWCPGAVSGPLGVQPLLNGERDGEKWPAWYLVRWLAARAGERFTSLPAVPGVVVVQVGNDHWLLTNTLAEEVVVACPSAATGVVFSLDDDGYHAALALTPHLTLTPYRVCVLRAH